MMFDKEEKLTDTFTKIRYANIHYTNSVYGTFNIILKYKLDMFITTCYMSYSIYISILYRKNKKEFLRRYPFMLS